MKYWWVNQNQTFAQETEGGYLWSPKTKIDGSRNTFYDNMVKVAPGDIVFSFYKTQIPAIGIITSHGYSQNKPEFGTSGAAWGTDGWMVNVDYRTVKNVITPKNNMAILSPLLPEKYSPLQANGKGNQGVYLAELLETLGEALLELVGNEVKPILENATQHIDIILSDNDAEEDRIEKLIRQNKNITSTETETIVKARKGQGKFRDAVLKLHKKCPFTSISNPALLKASHIKPWAKCETNDERLDPLNGLPLSPTADHLFDQGFISFTSDGHVISSSLIHPEDYQTLGIINDGKTSILPLVKQQANYLDFHRKYIFKK